MPKKVLRSDSGVTLLEISFAMGILVMTMSMLFGALINMQRSSQTVDSRSAANALMRSVAETIRTMDAGVIAITEFAPIERNGITYSVTVEFEDSNGNLVELPLSAGNTEEIGDGTEGESTGSEESAPLNPDSLDLNDFPNPIQARITLAWIVLPQTDEYGEIVGGRAMQLTTRTFVEGVGPVVVPGT